MVTGVDSLKKYISALAGSYNRGYKKIGISEGGASPINTDFLDHDISRLPVLTFLFIGVIDSCHIWLSFTV